mgnify:CR=1 FL=1
MVCKLIDMEKYPRRKQFEHFSKMFYPYAGMTVDIDISVFMKKIKDRKRPFYLSLLYAAARTANSIRELKQRIRGGIIVEYDRCVPSYTLALDKGDYCYCLADERLPFGDFLRDSLRKQEEARKAASLKDGENVEELFFFSSVPWVSYSSLMQPVPYPADSNPRIIWGKYYGDGEKIKLPVSLLVNHALMDGYQISEFFIGLQDRLDNPEWIE